MESKKYRYVKFEKLSDVVKAWEDGKDFFTDSFYPDQYKKVDGYESIYFFSRTEYYYREEIKPIVMVACFHEEDLEVIYYKGKPYQLKPYEHNYCMRNDYRKIDMREVIED